MSEIALLTAVRNSIRDLSDFSDREVEIEFDERAMQGIATKYVAVMPGGVTPGPYHNSSGGVSDKLYGVDVLVVKRGVSKPRDRARDLFLQNSIGLGDLIDAIETGVDFDYTVMNAANAIIGGSEGFIEPLVFAGLGRIATVDSSVFAGVPGENQAGLKRILMLRRARRIKTR